MSERERDFYVGYAPTLPPAEARVTRRAVVVLAALAVCVPLAIVTAQGRLAPASFEFGDVRDFRGTVVERPFPALLLERPDTASATGTTGAVSSLLLVAPGKFGASALVQGRDGEHVDLRGTLVYRDGRTMIEVVPDSIVGATGTPHNVAVDDLGDERLRGEIVDTKCNLGVMNPGGGKTHKACAMRCIAGGIPPMLVPRTADGNETFYLLVMPDGSVANEALFPFVGDQVEMTGRLEQQNDLLVFQPFVSSIRRR